MSTTGLLALYNAARAAQRTMTINRLKSFFPRFNKARITNLSAARSRNLFFMALSSALTALELLLIPTDLEAATMTDYYLSDEGMEELGNMSDKDLRQTIGFHGLSDALILELSGQLGNIAEAQGM